MWALGIDVSKDELVVSLQQAHAGEQPQVMALVPTVANSASGHTKLVRWLHKQLASHDVALADIHVVMEATNVYWEACAHHFHALGCSVSVVNPAQIKFFAKSTLRRGKTDAMDAEIIARFGLIMQPSGWQPPSPALVQIKQLVREREALLREHLRESNHLKALLQGQYATPLVVRLAKQRLRLMERHLVVIEAAIREAVACDGALQAQLDLLLSVPGFGFVAAATMLAETNGFETLTDGHQVAAYAGLAPAPNQSGHSNRRGTISKMGNARLRRIAYLAALGASRSQSPFKTFYQGLRQRGKPPKVALIALARKLLRVGLAVVKSGQPYQATYSRAPVTLLAS
jgi:transposase